MKCEQTIFLVFWDRFNISSVFQNVLWAGTLVFKNWNLKICVKKIIKRNFKIFKKIVFATIKLKQMKDSVNLKHTKYAFKRIQQSLARNFSWNFYLLKIKTDGIIIKI